MKAQTLLKEPAQKLVKAPGNPNSNEKPKIRHRIKCMGRQNQWIWVWSWLYRATLNIEESPEKGHSVAVTVQGTGVWGQEMEWGGSTVWFADAWSMHSLLFWGGRGIYGSSLKLPKTRVRGSTHYQGGTFRMHLDSRYHGPRGWAEVIVISLMPFIERKRKEGREEILRVKEHLYQRKHWFQAYF